MIKGVGVRPGAISRSGLTLLVGLMMGITACSDGDKGKAGDGGVLGDGGLLRDDAGNLVLDDGGNPIPIGQGGNGAGGNGQGGNGQGGDGQGGDDGVVVGDGGVILDDGGVPIGVGNPVPPSEDFLFASNFGNKRAQDVPPWKSVLFQNPQVRVRGWTRSAMTEATTTSVGQFDFQAQTPVAAATLEDAIATGRYAAIAFEPTVAGLSFDLNGATVTFAINRKNSVGAGNIAVLTSVGGFTADKLVYTGPAGAAAPSMVDVYTFTLPTAGYGDISGPFELRFYSLGTAGTKAPTAISAFWIGGKVNNVALMKTPKRRDIGTNLAPLKEYGTDSPFLDKFKMARPWFTSKVNAENKEYEALPAAVKLPLNAQGWPTQVPFTLPNYEDPRYVHTIIKLPYNGKWAVLYKGTGKIRLAGNALGVNITAAGGDGRTDFLLNRSNIGYGNLKTSDRGAFEMGIEIRESLATDPIRDIRVVHHANLTTYENEVFEPAFVARLYGFSPIRFMEWAHVNTSQETNWADRTPTDYYTQAGKSVAYEYMIKLLNLTKSDGWINVPHLATDEYMKQLATLFRDSLAPNLKVYVEFGNETWNTAPAFHGGIWVRNRAMAEGMNSSKFATIQQVRAWENFKQVYGDQFETRVRRPIGGWAVGDGENRARLNHLNDPTVNPNKLTAQGLALAPYFGRSFPRLKWPSLEPLEPLSPAPSPQSLLDDLEADLEDKRLKTFVELKKVATDFNVELWAIEGGQSLKASNEAAKNSMEFVDNTFAANRDPRMGMLYSRYIKALEEANFKLFMHFVFVEPWTKHGTWGGLEALDQAATASPKHRALEEAIFQ